MALCAAVLMLASRPASSATWSTAEDAAAFAQVPISLIHAIAIAHDKASEGHQPDRPINAWYDAQGRQYRVILVSQTQFVEARVPAGIKDQVNFQPAESIANLSPDDRRAATQPPPKGVDLELAAAKGDELGGSAIDAGLIPSKGGSIYRVDIIRDGRLVRIQVDPASGKAHPGG